MPKRTLTRADLSETIYQKVGLSRAESAVLVTDVLEELCKAAERGETIKLTGFGTFTLRDKKERPGRNPKTGEQATVTARRVMRFKPSKILQDKVIEAHLARNGDDADDAE